MIFIQTFADGTFWQELVTVLSFHGEDVMGTTTILSAWINVGQHVQNYPLQKIHHHQYYQALHQCLHLHRHFQHFVHFLLTQVLVNKDWTDFILILTTTNVKGKRRKTRTTIVVRNKIGHSSRSSSIQRSKTTEEVPGNVKQF